RPQRPLQAAHQRLHAGPAGQCGCARGRCAVSRPVMKALAAATLSLLALSAGAQELLIRNATVHTGGAQGTLQGADVLVSGGTIRAVGTGLSAPADAQVIDAQGRPVT